MERQPEQARVFVSYSHRDRAWWDLLREHLARLEGAGRLAVWSDLDLQGGDDWNESIHAEIQRSHVALALISPAFLQSDFIGREEIPAMLDARIQDGLRILPVLLEPSDWTERTTLGRFQALPSTPLSELEGRARTDALAGISERVWDLALGSDTDESHSSPLRTDFQHLPESDGNAFGRAEETRLLRDSVEDDARRIVALRAPGGVGKSALVRGWLNRFEQAGLPGIERAFGWSFYSQGEANAGATANGFLHLFEQWLRAGESPVRSGRRPSAWQHGIEVARLACEERTLIVLDGMEPLQSHADFERGRILDPGLLSFLLTLARELEGLCVITTREIPVDLAYLDTYRLVELQNLSPEAGRALFSFHRVKGTGDDLRQAAAELHNHALAVKLAAGLLRATPGRHIASLGEALGSAPITNGEAACGRILGCLTERMAHAEREVMHALGFFSRPTHHEELAPLIASPGIAGVSERLAADDGSRFEGALTDLRERGVLLPRKGIAPKVIDAHPIVRQYYRERDQERLPRSWAEGNRRLFAASRGETDIQRVVEAVQFGCRAGRPRAALEGPYQQGLMHGETNDEPRRDHGLYGLHLTALSAFYVDGWDELVPGLEPQEAVFVLKETTRCLRGLGQLRRAFELESKTLEFARESGDESTAVRALSYMAELCCTLGFLDRSLELARESVAEADEKGLARLRVYNRAVLADVLHERNELRASHEMFREAEAVDVEVGGEGELRKLSAVRLYSLLFDIGEFEAIRERVERLAPGESRLVAALSRLLLARTILSTSRPDSNDAKRAIETIETSVGDLYQVGSPEGIVIGIRSKAALSVERAPDRAVELLREGVELARRSEMRLFLTQCLLMRAEALAAIEELDRARKNLNRALDLIESTGFERVRARAMEIAKALAP